MYSCTAYRKFLSVCISKRKQTADRKELTYANVRNFLKLDIFYVFVSIKINLTKLL